MLFIFFLFWFGEPMFSRIVCVVNDLAFLRIHFDTNYFAHV